MRSLLFCCALTFVAQACAAPYQMQQPAAFRRFEESREYKLITADGVMLKVREVDNYPRAALDFWTAAMKGHLAERGYALAKENCFKTVEGREGCTLTFLLPRGAQDWVLCETLFVVEDDIVLVEAAGAYDRFAKIEGELQTALLTFLPRT